MKKPKLTKARLVAHAYKIRGRDADVVAAHYMLARGE